jgi:putative transcriptional regulator
MERSAALSTTFKSIKKGLLEAIEHASGNTRDAIIHRPKSVDVKALRLRIGMTQEQFAGIFGFSTATLRHWERGDRTPHGPARVLLNVIDHNPNAVIEALVA